jgi:hypothetical protein
VKWGYVEFFFKLGLEQCLFVIHREHVAVSFSPRRISDFGDDEFEPLTGFSFTEITSDRVVLESKISPVGQ